MKKFLIFTQNRTSSHDYWYVAPVKISFVDPTFVATFPTITGHLELNIENFDLQQFDVEKNGAYCTLPFEGAVVPKF